MARLMSGGNQPLADAGATFDSAVTISTGHVTTATSMMPPAGPMRTEDPRDQHPRGDAGWLKMARRHQPRDGTRMWTRPPPRTSSWRTQQMERMTIADDVPATTEDRRDTTAFSHSMPELRLRA